MPEVSVIIPNYNHAPFLRQRIESVLSQTYQDIEVLLLDDASTDESVAILKSYQDHPLVKDVIVNEKNSGSTFKQWKKGLELSQGTYIWIAESDDWADPQFLAKIMGGLSQNPQVDLYFTRSHHMDVEGKVLLAPTSAEKKLGDNIWKESYVREGKEVLPYFLPATTVFQNTSAVVFKKEKGLVYIEKITRFSKNGDYFFWILFCLGGAIGFTHEKLNYIRRDSSHVFKGDYSRQQEWGVLKVHFYLFTRGALGFLQMGALLKYHLKWLYREVIKPFKN